MTSYASISQQRAVTILRILYPVWTVLGIFSLLFVVETLVVPGDAATTAANLTSSPLLFNAGITGSLVTQLIHIAMVLLFWQLFKSVDRDQAGLILVFGLVSVPIAMLGTLSQSAALMVLSVGGLPVEQAQAWMAFFLDLNQTGIFIAQIFWGLWLFPIATLTYTSGYFPKIVGHFLMVAGVGYLLGSFGHILFLNDSSPLFMVFDLMAVGEILFMLWVVVRGARLPADAG